jgi:hypothetical protein
LMKKTRDWLRGELRRFEKMNDVKVRSGVGCWVLHGQPRAGTKRLKSGTCLTPLYNPPKRCEQIGGTANLTASTGDNIIDLFTRRL